MAADVAVISVISSAVVAVVGGVSGFYAQRVTLHNERLRRVEARLDDLRAVLDEAAEIAIGWNHEVGTTARSIHSSATVMDKVTTAMQSHRARLGVRVGPKSTVFVSYQELQRAIQSLEDELRSAPGQLTFQHLRNPTSLSRSLRPTAEKINLLSGEVYGAMDRFLVASSNLVGPAVRE